MYDARPIVNAGSRKWNATTNANCSRERKSGSRSMRSPRRALRLAYARRRLVVLAVFFAFGAFLAFGVFFAFGAFAFGAFFAFAAGAGFARSPRSPSDMPIRIPLASVP